MRPSQRRSRRHPAFTALRLAVTLALLAILFSYVNWGEIGRHLQRANLWLILLTIGLRYVGVAMSAWKWRQILAVNGLAFDFGTLHRWYYTGIFIGYFLPTNIGGDGYRVYRTWQSQNARISAAFAVFIERVTGFLALLLVGYAAVVIASLRGQDELVTTLLVTGTALLLGALIGFAAITRIPALRRTAARFERWRLVSDFLRFVTEFRHHPRATAVVAALSFLFHFNRILMVWLLLLALGIPWNVVEVAIVTAAKDVIGLLPISLGGLGLVDGSFVFLMAHFGLDAELGLSAMLLWRAQLLLIVLPGAYFYLAGERRASAPLPDRHSPDPAERSARVPTDSMGTPAPPSALLPSGDPVERL